MVQSLEKSRRNEVLRTMLSLGAGIRQLSRLTGVSFGVIQKLAKMKNRPHDLNNKEVELTPVHKAVYLLFLNHPEGIEFKKLSDYRDELLQYYMATAKLMDKQTISDSVDMLVNPLNNSINEKCSRIKSIFLNIMDQYTANYYIISGHTQKHFAGSSKIWYERLKNIKIPRELVIREDKQL